MLPSTVEVHIYFFFQTYTDTVKTSACFVLLNRLSVLQSMCAGSTERCRSVMMECYQGMVKNKWHFFVCTDMGEQISLMLTTQQGTDRFPNAHMLMYAVCRHICIIVFGLYEVGALTTSLFTLNLIPKL